MTLALKIESNDENSCQLWKKIKARPEATQQAHRDCRNVHFASFMDLRHLMHAEIS